MNLAKESTSLSRNETVLDDTTTKTVSLFDRGVRAQCTHNETDRK